LLALAWIVSEAAQSPETSSGTFAVCTAVPTGEYRVSVAPVEANAPPTGHGVNELTPICDPAGADPGATASKPAGTDGVSSTTGLLALDGLPLAIELAASRARTLTAEQIERQLARPLSVGDRGLRDLPDRQRTLEAAIRWSYDLLTTRE
jgi:hypothetical protein